MHWISYSTFPQGTMEYYKLHLERWKDVVVPPNSPFKVNEVGLWVYVQTDFHVTLIWDHGTMADVVISLAYRDKVLSLCGKSGQWLNH